ncbi:VCBS repeat-containing protein [Solirubrobacter phytolaccae]|uniref:VCBS repeat-containing protein n=1 Tax=Solirubrobacter phytolaccae TaxID=1404360 RepID=A0A9X3N871_9ACTN|nr:VCBS repeat-containing protein [Solirubrobacter phytolaccae]MDA0180219.1 VCBS repeat-containing protein [Solirubrobacter phytolaccae]
MKKSLFRTGVALAVLAATASPAHASFLQEIGSPFVVGASPVGLYPVDLNRDGLPDLISVNSGGDSITPLLRQPGGGFAAEAAVAVGDGPNFGAVADFNRDGWPDFAADGYYAGTASILLRNPPSGWLSAPSSPVATGPAASMAAADFNGDGFIDLAVGQYDAGTVQILRQRRDGTFVAEGAAIATGSGTRYITAADFNADGRPDLAVTSIGSRTLSILITQPDGSLLPEGTPIPVGSDPWMTAAADFTGDGLLDLALTNYLSDTVILLRRESGGGFTEMAGSPMASPGGPVGLAAADFNRDGLIDLAVGTHRTSAVNVLLRRPDGTFAHDSGSPLSVGTNPYGIVAEDFNRDGKPDVAAANGTSSNVTVLLNTTPDPPGPPPPPPPPPPIPPTPSLSARLVLGWSVSKTTVKLTSVKLRDAPIGSRVRIYCKPCKVSQTLTTKAKTVTLTKLRNKKLKRKATFTVTVTAPGYNGMTLTRKVKNYGRSRAALRKAVKAPFIEGRRCVPLSGPKC